MKTLLSPNYLKKSSNISQVSKSKVTGKRCNGKKHIQPSHRMRRIGKRHQTGQVIRFLINENTPDRVYPYCICTYVQPLQYELAKLLVHHTGRCVPYEIIFKKLWGKKDIDIKQINVQLCLLRKAMEQTAPDSGSLIKTIPLKGLILDILPAEVLYISEEIN